MGIKVESKMLIIEDKYFLHRIQQQGFKQHE